MKRLLTGLAACVAGLSLMAPSSAQAVTGNSASQRTANYPQCHGHEKPNDAPCVTGSLNTSVWKRDRAACQSKGDNLLYTVAKKTKYGTIGWYTYRCYKVDTSGGTYYHLVMYGYVYI